MLLIKFIHQTCLEFFVLCQQGFPPRRANLALFISPILFREVQPITLFICLASDFVDNENRGKANNNSITAISSLKYLLFHC